MGILADELDAAGFLGFLDIFDGHVLLAVDVDRQQIHVAPENIVYVAYLLIEDDIAAFEQRIHAVADHVDRPVAARQVRNVDVVHRRERALVQKQRNQPCRTLDIVQRNALRRKRPVGASRKDGRRPDFEEHRPLAGLEPVRIDIQFLNQYVPIPLGQGSLSRLDHRKGALSDTQHTGQTLLRQ